MIAEQFFFISPKHSTDPVLAAKLFQNVHRTYPRAKVGKVQYSVGLNIVQLE